MTTPNPAALQWTDADIEAADLEGWNIFNIDTHPEIQRDDEAELFESDEDAVAFVKASQSPHARKALAIVADRKSRNEAARTLGQKSFRPGLATISVY